MYLDLIKGYRVTIGGYNAPLKEHRENTATGFSSLGSKTIIIPHTDNYSMCGPNFSLFLHHKLSCMSCVCTEGASQLVLVADEHAGVEEMAGEHLP